MIEQRGPIKTSLRDPATPARMQAVWQRIESRRGDQRRRIAIAASAAFALVALIGIAAQSKLLQSFSSNDLRAAQAVPLTRDDGRPLGTLDASVAAVSVKLADASRIELSHGAKLIARVSTGQQLGLALLEGHVLFDVTPHGPRRWTIDAGDVTVEVLGTRFSVTRDGQAVNVEVERGIVSVSGQGVPNGRQLLTAHHALAVSASPVLSPMPPSAADHGVKADAAVSAPGLLPPNKSAPAHSHAPSAAAQRERDAASVTQLLAAADAARRAGDPKRAEQALQQITTQYASDGRAALAALSLGRVRLEQLRSPLTAAAAFERAIALGLPNSLAEDGCARLVEAYARAGQVERARVAAERYRTQFPNGRRRQDVEDWVKAE